jgi:hypothetical protein
MIKSPLPPEEIYFILSRSTSGILNGGFYDNMKWLGILGAVSTVFFTILSIRRKNRIHKYKKKWMNKLEKFLYWSAFFLALMSILMVLLSFLSPAIPFADIHFWTFLTQSFQMFAMFLNNPKTWWRILLLVAPAVFFQKLFINVLNNNPWNYQGTDVSSGKYYTMMGIKMPRLFSGNMYFRLAVTVFSIIILVLTNKQKTADEYNVDK